MNFFATWLCRFLTRLLGMVLMYDRPLLLMLNKPLDFLALIYAAQGCTRTILWNLPA
jgi:hypothetical protein